MGQVTQFVPGVANELQSVVVNIPASLLPQGRIVQHALIFNGNATAGDVVRIAVLAGGIPVYNMLVGAANTQHFLAFLQRFWGIGLNPAVHYLPIPFYFGDEAGQLERDVCQVPPGLPISIQITFGAFGAAGADPSIDVISTITDVEPQWTPLLISSSMGILLNQNNRPYDPKTSGLLRGITINPTGLARFYFSVAGVQIFNGASGASLIAEQVLKDTTPGATGATLNPICRKTLPWRPMNSGGTIAQLTTGAAWAGAGNELGLYTVIPVVKGVPTMPLMAGAPGG